MVRRYHVPIKIVISMKRLLHKSKLLYTPRPGAYCVFCLSREGRKLIDRVHFYFLSTNYSLEIMNIRLFTK